MKLLKHIILVNASDEQGHALLLNTLTGEIDVLSAYEASIIQKWEREALITPSNSKEIDFFQELLAAGFLVDSDAKECEIVEQVMQRCRARHDIINRDNPIIVFVLTYMCNFACPYCYENAANYSDNKIMTHEMVDKVFEIHGYSLKNIAFYGGEPFLPKTQEIVQYIISKAPDAFYSVTTNGYYLKEFVEILKTIKVRNIMVTLDGPEQLHNQTRILKSGKGTYDKIMEGIRLCLANSIPIKIRMNISELNMEECLNHRELLIKTFSSEYSANLLSFELQPLFDTPSERKKHLNDQIVFKSDLDSPTPYKYNMITNTLSPILRSFLGQSRDFKPRYCHCDAEGKRRFYDPEGLMYSCILSLKNKTAAIGEYYPSFHLKANSFITRNIESIPQCRDCKLKFLCGGGCANAVLGDDGNALKPNCTAIMDEIYYELPRLFNKYINRK